MGYLDNAGLARFYAGLKTKFTSKLGAHPVGCVYTSTSSTSPAQLFGGTWERMKDMFLLAAGDSYAAGSTGGAASVTLTTDEMPWHTHRIAYSESGQPMPGNSGQSAYAMYGACTSVITTSTEHGAYYDTYPVSSGGDQAHNNMPPYVAVYMWKRVA